MSDRGRIRSVKFKKIKVLNQYTNSAGYKFVDLRKDGTRLQKHSHRIVAEAFLGLPAPGMETLHLDGVRDNNVLENLKWGTHSENMKMVKGHRLGRLHKNKTEEEGKETAPEDVSGTTRGTDT